MFLVTLQRIDGVLRVKVPEGVTAQDFTDWLNDEPHKMDLELVEKSDKWVWG